MSPSKAQLFILSSKLVFKALWNLEFKKRFTNSLKMSKTSGKMNLGYASYGYNIDVNIWSAHQHHNITQRRWRHVLYFAFTSALLIKCCRPLSSVCRPCGRYFILGGTTVHPDPDEIVPKRGPLSVEYEESDRKVNQSGCQLQCIGRGSPHLKSINSFFIIGGPHLKFINL